MRKAEVYDNHVLSGTLEETDEKEYIFRYDDRYLADASTQGVSLTLPKRQAEYHSQTLFPFFFNMLSEGANKRIQCTALKIDGEDYFGLLLATCGNDTIGSITVKRIV